MIPSSGCPRPTAAWPGAEAETARGRARMGMMVSLGCKGFPRVKGTDEAGRIVSTDATVLLRLHRWITLSLGLLFTFSGLTGSLIVFGPEIDRVLNPGLYRATDGPDVGLDRVRGAVERAFPGSEAGRIDLPAMPRAGGVYRVWLRGKPERTVYVDPASGAVLGARREDRALVGLITALHIRLASARRGRRSSGSAGSASCWPS